jgi:hypothetical protein
MAYIVKKEKDKMIMLVLQRVLVAELLQMAWAPVLLYTT